MKPQERMVNVLMTRSLHNNLTLTFPAALVLLLLLWEDRLTSSWTRSSSHRRNSRASCWELPRNCDPYLDTIVWREGKRTGEMKLVTAADRSHLVGLCVWWALVSSPQTNLLKAVNTFIPHFTRLKNKLHQFNWFYIEFIGWSGASLRHHLCWISHPTCDFKLCWFSGFEGSNVFMGKTFTERWSEDALNCKCLHSAHALTDPVVFDLQESALSQALETCSFIRTIPFSLIIKKLNFKIWHKKVWMLLLNVGWRLLELTRCIICDFGCEWHPGIKCTNHSWQHEDGSEERSQQK